MKNEFFDSDKFEFEVEGFYEELVEVGGKTLGIRMIAEPTLPLGSPGMLQYRLTETTELQRGMKMVTVKASPKRPVLVSSQLQVLCGKTKIKWKHEKKD